MIRGQRFWSRQSAIQFAESGDIMSFPDHERSGNEIIDDTAWWQARCWWWQNPACHFLWRAVFFYLRNTRNTRISLQNKRRTIALCRPIPPRFSPICTKPITSSQSSRAEREARFRYPTCPEHATLVPNMANSMNLENFLMEFFINQNAMFLAK